MQMTGAITRVRGPNDFAEREAPLSGVHCQTPASTHRIGARIGAHFPLNCGLLLTIININYFLFFLLAPAGPTRPTVDLQ